MIYRIRRNNRTCLNKRTPPPYEKSLTLGLVLGLNLTLTLTLWLGFYFFLKG